MDDTNNAQLTNQDQENELEILKKSLEEEKEARLMLMSDFQNFKKRMEGERALFGAMANMGIIQEVLEVTDDLALGLNDENLSLEHAVVSLKSAQDKLLGLISESGVEVISVKAGDEFNKEFMEAISTVDAGEDKKNKVVAVISSAYKYANREGVLKPAKVIVGK